MYPELGIVSCCGGIQMLDETGGGEGGQQSGQPSPGFKWGGVRKHYSVRCAHARIPKFEWSPVCLRFLIPKKLRLVKTSLHIQKQPDRSN